MRLCREQKSDNTCFGFEQNYDEKYWLIALKVWCEFPPRLGEYGKI